MANENVVIAFTVDGRLHRFGSAEMRPLDYTLLRQQVGLDINEVYLRCAAGADLEAIAVLAWLARLQAGEDVEYAAVAASFNGKSKIQIVDDEEPGSPEL